MSIIVQTRTCADCGGTFKVDSRSKVETCFGCGQVAALAAEAEHAERHAAAMVEFSAAHADEDPFLNRWGQPFGMTHTGKDPFRAVKP